MATTISNATLTVTITESLTLNSYDQGSSNVWTVANCNEAFKRILSCVNGQNTTIATFDSNNHDSGSPIDVEDAKYVRVTNLDASESVELAVVGAATLYQVTLPPYSSHILASPSVCMLAEADTSPSFGTMADVASLIVRPTGSAVVDIEVFVASA